MNYFRSGSYEDYLYKHAVAASSAFNWRHWFSEGKTVKLTKEEKAAREKTVEEWRDFYHAIGRI